MEHQIALELVRITEKAALEAARWTGRGDKNSADEAATTAIRSHLNSVAIDGTVVIGEGEMDEAPMLYIGETVGNRRGPKIDIAVDPIEGTETVANGLNDAISVLAAAPEGNLLHAPDIYMEKLAVGPQLAGHLSLNDPIETTLKKASAALNKSMSEMTVSILDRERHRNLIGALRKAGVRIKLLKHGDVMGAIEAATDSEVDMYIGSGGAPEGVLAAAALKSLGGEMQGRLLPDGPEETERVQKMGLADPRQLLGMDDLVGTDHVIFVATGITGGDFLSGVRYMPNQKAETHSVIMHSGSQMVSFLRTIHKLPLTREIFTHAAI